MSHTFRGSTVALGTHNLVLSLSVRSSEGAAALLLIGFRKLSLPVVALIPLLVRCANTLIRTALHLDPPEDRLMFISATLLLLRTNSQVLG